MYQGQPLPSLTQVKSRGRLFFTVNTNPERPRSPADESLLSRELHVIKLALLLVTAWRIFEMYIAAVFMAVAHLVLADGGGA